MEERRKGIGRKRSPERRGFSIPESGDRATHYKIKCYAFIRHSAFKKATQFEQRGQELSTKSLWGFGKGLLSPDDGPLRGVLCEALC